MENAELVLRDHSGSTKFPELHASFVYCLPDGGRVTLMSTVGCMLNPEAVERFIVEPFGELGIPVVRLKEPALPTDDIPVLFTNYDRLWMLVEMQRLLLLSLADRCIKQSDLLSSIG